MVIGNGLIASRFSEYVNNKSVLIFASGVSNSKETKDEEFEQEIELIYRTFENYCKNYLFVYFSTCSVYDKEEINSPYVQHKMRIEKIIESTVPDFNIFRVSQAVGFSENKNTLLNFLFDSISKDRRFSIWNYAYRNLIDIDDLFAIVNEILKKGLFRNSRINVANRENIHILTIVEQIEKFLGKQAKYDLIPRGSNFEVEIDKIEKLIDKLEIRFDHNYLMKILYKYYK